MFMNLSVRAFEAAGYEYLIYQFVRAKQRATNISFNGCKIEIETLYCFTKHMAMHLLIQILFVRLA